MAQEVGSHQDYNLSESLYHIRIYSRMVSYASQCLELHQFGDNAIQNPSSESDSTSTAHSTQALVAAISFALANWIMLKRTMTLAFNQGSVPVWSTGHDCLALDLTPDGVLQVIYFTLPHSSLPHFNIVDSSEGYIYFPALILEAVICFLTVIKTYQKATGMYPSKTNLFLVLYRDGVSYYVLNLLEAASIPVSQTHQLTPIINRNRYPLR
ncbi:9915_t:CDS:2 [Acaulospora colombiana]|uniref:9915_t:CDS:1 n=1 Tax=Acaulospora colombiana TaxID=27376 RepID=A0ACA9MY66_9GLOM|nr:9915_t:CDS:2 [Acaulospora colombiana]